MSSKYYLNAIVATILVSSSLVSITEARDELSPSKEAKDIDNRDLWATWGWSAPEPSGWSGSSKAGKGSKGSKGSGSGSGDGGWSAPEPSGDAWHGGSGSSKAGKGSKGSKSHNAYGSGSGSGDGGWSAPEPSGDGWNGDGYW